jgi:acetyl esterase/lipase
MTLYRGMDQAALDTAYNNTAAVADSAGMLADWEVRSSAHAAAHPEHLELRYGPRERNRIDFFAAEASSNKGKEVTEGNHRFPSVRGAGRPESRRAPPSGAPVLVFIHGGYWQMRAKETFRFVAAGPLAHGISVANVAYTLAPDATLQHMVDEVRSAITWVEANAQRLGADPKRIYVSGWSAGGHLTAMSMTHPAVQGGLAISGIFDLEPIRLSYLNEKLALDEDAVQRLSPLLNMPVARAPLAIAYGTQELPELQRQSCEFAAARERAGLPGQLTAIAGHNHFTILEELAKPDGALTAVVRELVS